jgi:hypothetical protein
MKNGIPVTEKEIGWPGEASGSKGQSRNGADAAWMRR